MGVTPTAVIPILILQYVCLTSLQDSNLYLITLSAYKTEAASESESHGVLESSNPTTQDACPAGARPGENARNGESEDFYIPFPSQFH